METASTLDRDSVIQCGRLRDCRKDGPSGVTNWLAQDDKLDLIMMKWTNK